MAEKQLISVYRSSREEGLYLYTTHQAEKQSPPFSTVPEELLNKFGEPTLALSLQLTPERKLARANAADVLKAIEDKGYYLQLPPSDFIYKTTTEGCSNDNQ